MNILVTGGCGFIGAFFIRGLLEQDPGVKIINLDAMTYAASQARLSAVENHPRYRFIQGNICNRNIVEKIFAEEDLQAVVNFAAESHVDRSISDSKPFVWTNYVGVQVLLDCAKNRNLKKFIQISTDEVYGPLGERGEFSEQDPLIPTNPYAATKAAADLLCLAYFHTHQVPIVITRSVNNYGAYQNPEKLIPLLIQRALQGENLPLYGDGKNRRSWLHVTDHCAALYLILHHAKPGSIYNIAGCEERSNLEVAKRILQVLGKPEDLICYVADRPGHDFRYQLNAARLIQECSWAEKVKFEAGLAETIAWYREHTQWVKAMV